MKIHLFFSGLIALSLALFSSQPVRAETGVTEKEILLGESTNMTGQSPDQSVRIMKGAELYFKLLNERGGVSGRKIKVINYDDGYEPKRALDNAKKLIETDKVFALFQFYGTPTAMAVLPTIEKTGVPYFAPISGADTLREPARPSVFPIRASASDEAKAIVQNLIEVKKIKNFAVFYQDDAFGVSGRTALQKVFAKYNGKRLEEATYQRNTLDVDDGLKKILQTKPPAVVIWGLAQPAAAFIKKAAAIGYRPVYFVTSTAAQPELTSEVTGLGVEVYGARCVPLLSDLSLPIVKEFKAAASKSGVKPDPAGLEGFFNAAVFTHVLQMIGKDLTRPKLRDAIETMSQIKIDGVDVHFSAQEHSGMTKASLENLAKPL